MIGQEDLFEAALKSDILSQWKIYYDRWVEELILNWKRSAVHENKFGSGTFSANLAYLLL